MATLDEIIAKHVTDSDRMRRAMEGKLEEHRQQLYRLVADYELERDNPKLAPDRWEDFQSKALSMIQTQAWAIEEMEARLKLADDALHGRNRAERRRRNGVKT